ncbi:MAG: histidinol-phosphate transaminase [Bacteroidetes bacterium]|nr:histidinol-phosphate transaminase [Bacteroidota bacterium]
MKKIKNLLRENIKSLVKYSSARDEFSDKAVVFLDANENPFNNGLNRYPDPLQRELKKHIGFIKGIPTKNILLGNGSDEVLDIIIRAFCEPGKDNIILTPPTYGMYKVLADINNVEVRNAFLNKDFNLNVERIEKLKDENTKLIILCSPNNPTGNSLNKNDIEYLLKNLNCMVVIDEAYIDFSDEESRIKVLGDYPNLIVSQTLSKAWGLAAIRLGICFASEYLISVFNKIKAPYNVNLLSQQKAIEMISDVEIFKNNLIKIKKEKAKLKEKLISLPFVEKVFPSDANFLLIKVTNAKKIYEYLINNGIVIRNRSKMHGCDNCLRISVGILEENEKLISTMKKYNL